MTDDADAPLLTPLTALGFFVGVMTVAGGLVLIWRDFGGLLAGYGGLSPLLVLVGVGIAVASAGVGFRYGNFARYHEDYDSETGRIEGHWFGRLQDAFDPEDDG